MWCSFLTLHYICVSFLLVWFHMRRGALCLFHFSSGKLVSMQGRGDTHSLSRTNTLPTTSQVFHLPHMNATTTHHIFAHTHTPKHQGSTLHRNLELQLTIIFNINLSVSHCLDKLTGCLVRKTERNVHCRFPQPEAMSSNVSFCPDQHSTQRHLVYLHRGRKKLENIHIWEKLESENLDIFLVKMTQND